MSRFWMSSALRSCNMMPRPQSRFSPVLLSFAAAVVVLGLPQTPSDEAELNRSLFYNAYGLTFELDRCGDRTLGSEWRGALRQFVQECRFPSELERELLQGAALADERFRNQQPTDQTQGIAGGRQTCATMMQGWQIAELRRNLLAYRNHMSSASAALKLNCDGSDRQ